MMQSLFIVCVCISTEANVQNLSCIVSWWTKQTIGFALISIFVFSFRLCFLLLFSRKKFSCFTDSILSQFLIYLSLSWDWGWEGTGIFHCQPRLERERNTRMTCFYSSSFILLRSITKPNLNSKYLPCTKQINLFPLDLSHETWTWL